jgi:hypothetical protein
MMEKIMIIISGIAFTSGVLYTWFRWGVKKSISVTFYEHEKRFAWYMWCFLYAAPMLIFAHGLMFLSFAGIVIVGVAPDFRGSRIQGDVHVAGAYTAIIAAFLFLVLQGVWVPAGLMALFALAAKLANLRNLTTWVEIAAYYLVIIGLWTLS